MGLRSTLSLSVNAIFIFTLGPVRNCLSGLTVFTFSLILLSLYINLHGLVSVRTRSTGTLEALAGGLGGGGGGGGGGGVVRSPTCMLMVVQAISFYKTTLGS